jgi:hypothetical protein
VTHLVVEPDHDGSLARLVSAELARACDDTNGAVTLRATLEEVRRLPRVEEVAYPRPDHFPLNDSDCDVGVQEVFALPYYSAYDVEPVPLDTAVVYDRIPKSKIEIRRASAV